MAKIEKLVPILLKWEGGFVNDPLDLGGETNQGVCLNTWQKVGHDKNGDGIIDRQDLLLLTQQDVVYGVLKPHYWDRWQADKIQDQSIANILVDWVWMSGAVGITIPQRLLGVAVDGIVGEKTLVAVNGHPNPQQLFDRIKAEREVYIEHICRKRPANIRFKKGWLNRLRDYRYLGILLCCCWLLTSLSSCKTKWQDIRSQEQSMEQQVIQEESLKHLVQETKRKSEKKEDLREKAVQITESQWVFYDTSKAKDSLTNEYPIRAILRTTQRNDTQVEI